MSRPRKRGSKDLPANLYSNQSKGITFYRYKDPRTGKFHGLGGDKSVAVRDALALNNAIYTAILEAQKADLHSPSTPVFSEFAELYLQRCEKRGQAYNTIRSKQYSVNHFNLTIGNTPVGEITVKDIAAILECYIEEGKDRAAQAARSCAIEIFKEAAHDGLVDKNPALATRNPRAKVKRSRLSLDQYHNVISAARSLDPWVVRSMQLALITGQRREDIAELTFEQVQGDFLFIVQAKTKARIKLHLDLRLECVGLSLRHILKECDDGIQSDRILHHSRAYAACKPGDPVHINTLSRKFAAARDSANLVNDAEKGPATFHELRSLAARLWTQQEGKEFAQVLLGHKDERMTAVYRDDRGSAWHVVQLPI